MVSILTCPSNSYFNPRSREGSDNSVKPFVIRIDSISIHAPARGATLFRNVMQLETQISIHAPARGATVKELCEIVWGEFQSTLPRGERRVFLCHVTDNRSISIHAPARGATKQAAAPFRNCSYFNPRSREWSDGRRVPGAVAGEYFNPRSREWSDEERSMLFAAGVRFQSTLPRVERPLYSRYRPAPSHFNPRSREWSDADGGRKQNDFTDFNPRSREWSDF